MTSAMRLADGDVVDYLDDVTATVEVAADGTVEVVGYVVRWDQAGQTSAGRLTFPRGSIELPDDLTRVKLLVEHRTLREVIGHGGTAVDDARGLFMRFPVPDPDRVDARQAIEGVRLKLRDSFSPGVELSDGTRLRLRRAQLAPARGNGRLREVSLVVVPGFDDWGPGEDEE